MLFASEKNHLFKGFLLALVITIAVLMAVVTANAAKAEGTETGLKKVNIEKSIEKTDFSKNLKYWIPTIELKGFSAEHPVLVEYTVTPNPTEEDWKVAGELKPGETKFSLDCLKKEKLDYYNLQVRVCEITGETIDEENAAKAEIEEKAGTESAGSIVKEPTTESQLVKNEDSTKKLAARNSGWITADVESIQVGSVEGDYAPLKTTVSRTYSYKTNAKNIRRGREYRYPQILVNTHGTYLTEYRYRLNGGRWSGWVMLPRQSAGHQFEKLQNLERKVYGRYIMDIEARWIDTKENVKGVATRSSKTVILGSRKIDFGKLAVKQARKYKGARYYGGGESRYRIDCSGLVLKAWKPFGVNLYHKSDTQVHSYWTYCGR